LYNCFSFADGLTTPRPAEGESLLAVLLQRGHLFQKEVTKHNVRHFIIPL